MKLRILPVVTLALVLNAACAQATPTVDPAQIQASAVAAANTMVAMTQAAIPTPTEVPPTPVPSPTPLPSPTLEALPTLPFDAPPTTAPSTTGDDCNHLFDVGSTGNARAKVLIVNQTKGSITITLGISTKNAFGQCGYLSWSNIAKGSNIVVSVPQTGQGPCYWAYAWVNDPKKQTTVANNVPFCMNNPDKWTMRVNYDVINLTPP
jgi:hypothetical protein